ncbi:MAG: thiamine phosphate synthase [Hyphomicrobiaceae bacterium]
MTGEVGRTRLYLVIEPGPAASDRLSAALAAAAGEIASLLIVPQAARPLDLAAIVPLVTAAQAHEVAVLIADDAALAREAGADGVHMRTGEGSVERARQARRLLGPDMIVGLDAGRSRHDAMSAGEDGADYVAFGIPAFVGDRETAAERRLDLCRWWAEVFEPPCVAFDVTTADDAASLAEAGADFVAFDLGEALSAADIAARVRAFASAVGHRAEAL